VRAELEIGCKDPELVLKSIGPDLGGSGRFTASLKAAKKSVKLTVESGDLTGLLAGVNSYARLIKTSTDIDDLEE
jgi:tRNA threonylcarbamoyladenosine modification (KEOPS) complex  Pcc1 subunit